jgi:HEAT repeat protein
MRPHPAVGLLLVLVAGCGKKPDPARVPGPAAPGSPAPGAAKAPPAERDQLLAALKTKRGDAQRRAVERLAELAEADPAVIPALVDLLRDRTTAGPGKTSPVQIGSVREAAAVTLLRAGPPGEDALRDKGIAALREGLTDKDPAVREHTAHTLGLLGPAAKPAAAAVQKLCGDPDERVREVAFDAVAAIGSPDVPALAALLNSDDPAVRRRAAEAVGQLTDAPAGAVGSFTRALLSDDEAVRLAAASGLAVAPLDNPPRQVAENLAAAIRKGYPEKADPENARLDGPEAVYWWALARCGKVAVTPAADLLTHPNGMVRLMAARTLGDLGPEAKPAVPALDKALNDPDAGVALEVACTLARLGEKADNVAALVRAALASSAPGVAAAAVEAVARMGPAGAALVPAALEKLGSLQPDARYAAVWLVGQMPPGEAAKHLPGLAKLAADPEPYIRGKVAEVLEGLGPAASPAAEAVGRQLRAEDDDTVRGLWVDALAAMGPGAKPAAGGLLPLVSDPAADPGLRARVIVAVAAADPGSAEVAAALAKATADPDLAVRAAAAAGIGRLDPLPDEARAALAKMARGDAKIEGRAAAVRAFVAAGPRAKAARPDLEAVAAGGYPGLDLWARVALAAVDGDVTTAAATVRAGLSNKSLGVRTAAAEALVLLGPTEADVPALVKLTREQSAAARAAAAEALGRIGPGAKAAVPRLAALLTAREAEVRSAAAEALGRIGPAARPALSRLREAEKDPASGAAARRAIEAISGDDSPGR